MVFVDRRARLFRGVHGPRDGSAWSIGRAERDSLYGRTAASRRVSILEDAPEAIKGAGIDGLLVDQVTSAGDTVAEIIGLPFVTVCNALALNSEPAIPPAVTPWRYRRGWIWRVRNAFGDRVFRWLAKPILDEINAKRLRHGLPPLAGSVSKNASLAQIAQQPAFFDYPRERLPECFHYTGPWHAIDRGDAVEFPWQKLDGRPLVYASMGTLQNRQKSIFDAIAAACAGLDVQLVLSLGNRDQQRESKFVGTPIVVPFAPQLELLRRAALTITHAGLNTALESLAQGVPMVAISHCKRSAGSGKPLGMARCGGGGAAAKAHGIASPRERAANHRQASLPCQGAAVEAGDCPHRWPRASGRYR